MPMNDALIAELNREGAATRRVLERIPDDKLSWAPHPKSMTLGTLGLHVAMIPGAIADLLADPVREVTSFTPPEAKSTLEILSAFDSSLSNATSRLTSWRDVDFQAEWRLTAGDKTLLAMPRADAVRTVMFNHVYHHRGQLTVYLRQLEVPLPSVYGPTADERLFG